MNALDEREAEQLLLQLADGDLPAVDAARAEERLLSDPRFAPQLRQQRALQARLGLLRNPEVPDGFEARLQARLAQVKPSAWQVLAQWVDSWRVPLVLGGALAAGVGLLWWQPVSVGAGNQGVGVSSVMTAPVAAAEVSLRVRVAPAQWNAVAQALRRGGVTVAGEPVARGNVSVWESTGTGSSTRAAVEALNSLVPVEVVGSVPASDVPVRLRVVLVTP